MSTQQDIYAAGSESRPPMLNKENYVPWSSRLLCYGKSRPNGKLIHNSIINGPYVRRMIPEPGDTNREVPVNETFHVQTDDELTEKELKQIEADDQVIQTILLGLPEDIYAAVDSCETAQEIWFTSNEGESIESYYHRFLKLMNDLKRNKHFPEKIPSNLKFLNNLQPEWNRHVTIVHQTKDLHTADYTQLYDFLKYNQKEVDELKAERFAKIQDPLALMANSNNPYAFLAPHQDQPSFNQNYIQQPMPNPEDITDPTTAMNMALTLMAKAFKLNYSTPINNNKRILSNPHNRESEWVQCYSECQESGKCNWVKWKPDKVLQLQGVGHYARNCTVGPRRRDAAYLQTQLLIAQKEEAGIQLQAKEFDLMAAAADLDEIKEVNANCILMANLQQASTSGTHSDKAPVYDSDGSAEEKSTVSFLLEEKKKLKSDFKTRKDELLDKQIQLEKKIKELNNILVKTGQSIQTIHMLSPKPDSFYHTEQKMALGYQNPFYLKQAQKKQQSLYDSKVLLEKHDPLVVHDFEETLQLAQESREKMKQLNKEIKPENYTKINHLSRVFVSQTAKSREELYFSNDSKTANVSKSISIPNEEFSDDTTPSVARKFLNEVKSTIITLQRVFKHRMPLETHNWSSSAHQELHKIIKDENFPIVNQVDARVQNFEIQFLKEAAKFAGDFKSLAKEADESLAKQKTLEFEIERLLRAVVSGQKDNAHDMSANTKFTKQSIMEILPKVGETHALSKPVTSNSVSTPQESKGVNNDKVITSGMFRINPFKTSRVDNTKTRRPQPKSNTKNDRVFSASKSSRSKNKEAKVKEHQRNLLLSKNTKHMSSACNNIKLDSQNVISKVVCAMCKQCLISVNHDVCLRNYVKGKTSRGKKHKANVSIKEKQKKHQPHVKKPKKVGFIERLATPKPRKPRFLLRWSPTGRLFDQKGKIIDSSESESQSDCYNGNLKLLINFVWKFMGTVRFENDHVAAILGFGDLQRGNILITRVYFVEGLGHNLFSVGQFCDSDLEVTFRRNACYVRNLDGVDLLKGDRSINLYTINLHEMASASPICLMARASSTKSWLWHQRLSHLNFDTINDLARNNLVSGLPKFEYHKEHLCPSCKQEKSKRASHPPKPVLNLRQRLHLLHIDLCGPMRIASINGKRYVLVIVDDYSRYTWVYFLRSKDEAPEVIKTFLKRITVLLQSHVIIIRIDNGTEFKNQALKEYFDSVGISHQMSSVRTPQQN
nr:retrovirus-related Pol polyprotein from transposon TNT 1-94 [Tanacetum cinerariifolium]